MAKKLDVIYGNQTTGIIKLEAGKYKFKVRFGTNKASDKDYGLFDKQKTVKVSNNTEAKKLFLKFKEEMQNQYIEEKARYEEKQETAETQYIADNVDESLLDMTFKEFTYSKKGEEREGLLFSNIPRNKAGDNYSLNTINLLRKETSVINQDEYKFFNEMRLVEIGPDDAEKLIEELRKRKRIVNKAEGIYEPISNGMIQKYINNLKIVFNSLESVVKLRKKDTNPFMGMRAGTIKYKKDGKTSLDTIEEYDKVKEELKNMVTDEPNDALFYLFAMISMLRRGEISALTWDDLNFEDKTLNIKGVIVEDTHLEKVYYRKYTKSDEVRLSIMNNELIEILKRLKPKYKNRYWIDESGIRHNLIFLDEDGNPYKLNHWTIMWSSNFRPKLQKKGLIKKQTTLHDLRGSGISYYLIEKKLDVTVLARIVGHTDIALTLNVYANATDNNIKQLAKEIE